MTDLDRDIAALEASLRHLKKLRKSERMQGRRHSDVTKAKMSAARKAAWADPAVRAKMSAARKAAWADPAVRAKMSAASKAAWAEKYEQDMRPKQRRETRKCLPPVPRDPYEAMLFGGGRR